MPLITERPLTPREFLAECLAFKREHPVQGRFFSVFLDGQLTDAQLRLWAKEGLRTCTTTSSPPFPP